MKQLPQDSNLSEAVHAPLTNNNGINSSIFPPESHENSNKDRCLEGIAGGGQSAVSTGDCPGADKTREVENVYSSEHSQSCECKACLREHAYRKELQLLASINGKKYIEQIECEEFEQTDWSDLELQLGISAGGKAPGRHDRLRHIMERISYVKKNDQPGYWNNQNEWNAFGSLSSIIACSYAERQADFCVCGYKVAPGENASCQVTDFCPRCCYNILCKPVLEKHKGTFGQYREVWFITVSVTREKDERKRLLFRDLNTKHWRKYMGRRFVDRHNLKPLPYMEPEDFLQVQEYWQLFRKVLGRHWKKYFAGGFGRHEMAVQFHPAYGCLPNSHYVFFCDGGYDVEAARQLRRELKKAIHNSSIIKDKLNPSLAVFRLRSSEDLERVTKYVFKPIPLHQPYGIAAKMGDYAPAYMETLNSCVNRYLEGYEHSCHGIHRSQSWGTGRKREKSADRTPRSASPKSSKDFDRKRPKKRKLSSKQRAARIRSRMENRRFVRDLDFDAEALRNK